jgi:hypothetical protein
MENNNKFYLYNRDGASLWLVSTDTENEYVLNCDENHKYIFEYACMNYEEVPDDAEIFDFIHNDKKGIYHSFDPSGGPYIHLGFKINEKTVQRIYSKNNQITFVIK